MLPSDCRNDPSPVGPAADHNGFALELGIEHLFHRDEERVEVDMNDGSACHIWLPWTIRDWSYFNTVTSLGKIYIIRGDKLHEKMGSVILEKIYCRSIDSQDVWL